MEELLSPPRYRLFGADTWSDPFELYAQLRTHDPVHHVPLDGGRDYWVLTRHRDVFAAVRDHETFSSAQGLTVGYGELEAIGLADNPPFVMTDPPTHTEFRSLVSRGFTPRQVESLEPVIGEFVRTRLEDLAGRGGGDVVGELFKPLPSMVVAHYLGVPESDRSQFDVWTDAVVAANASGRAGDAGAAVVEMMGYFSELVAHRRRHPGEDTVSHLVAAGVGDDDAGLLRILAFTFTMVTGGNDTTTGLLGGTALLLGRHPEQRAAALADPGSAVEELLRLTSPVQGLARTTTRDVEIDGTTIPAGRKVLMCYAAANRDPQVYGPDAEEVDVTRNPRQVLTFSHGAHHCLGAAVTRMTARRALTELLTLLPDFTVDESTLTWADGSYVRRPTRLELRP